MTDIEVIELRDQVANGNLAKTEVVLLEVPPGSTQSSSDAWRATARTARGERDVWIRGSMRGGVTSDQAEMLRVVGVADATVHVLSAASFLRARMPPDTVVARVAGRLEDSHPDVSRWRRIAQVDFECCESDAEWMFVLWSLVEDFDLREKIGSSPDERPDR